MSMISAAAKRLQAALALVSGAGLIGYSDAQAYTAGTMGARIKAMLAGFTMTGPLVLPGDAAGALHAVPKQQLDAAIGAVLDGATFTGPVVLPGAASTGLQAVTLAQLEAAIASVVAAGEANFAPGDIALSAMATNPSGLQRVLVQGQAIDITGIYSTLAPLWCGAVLNNNADPLLKADFFYRCTNPADPSNTRDNAGNYLKLPDPGYFLRVLNTGGAGMDAGRSPFKYQADMVGPVVLQLLASSASGGSRAIADPLANGVMGAAGDVSGYANGPGGQPATPLVAAANAGTETRGKNWGVYVWMWY